MKLILSIVCIKGQQSKLGIWLEESKDMIPQNIEMSERG